MTKYMAGWAQLDIDHHLYTTSNQLVFWESGHKNVKSCKKQFAKRQILDFLINETPMADPGWAYTVMHMLLKKCKLNVQVPIIRRW